MGTGYFFESDHIIKYPSKIPSTTLVLSSSLCAVGSCVAFHKTSGVELLLTFLPVWSFAASALIFLRSDSMCSIRLISVVIFSVMGGFDLDCKCIINCIHETNIMQPFYADLVICFSCWELSGIVGLSWPDLSSEVFCIQDWSCWDSILFDTLSAVDLIAFWA